jgi:hypothetical protein
MMREPNASPAELSVGGEHLGPDLNDAISLSLGDLLPDSGGSIVIEGDTGNLTILLATDRLVVDQGVVDHRVTSAGEDVSGHAFFAFDHGLTVFYPTDVQLSIVPEVG